MDFNWIYKNVELKGEVDERYFIKTEEGYRYAPILLKIIANDAVAFFRERIITLDEKREYSYEKVILVDDIEATKAAEAPYKEKYSIFNKRWEEYKNTHPEEFVKVWKTDGSYTNELHKITVGFNPNIVNSAKDAVAGYKIARAFAERYNSKGSEYDSLPKYSAISSSPEYQNIHDNMKKEWRKELGLPEKDADLKIKVEKNVIEVRNISFKNIKAVSENEDLLEDYAKKYVEYIQSQ